MRTQVLVLWRHRASFQVHHEALEHCSVTLLSLRPLRFYVANDKRSLPQSAQSCGEKEMELMKNPGACALAPSGLVPGFIVRPWTIVQ